jgi:hypothetical protein
MRPISVTVMDVGVSAPIPLDIYANPTTVALGVEIIGTGVTCSVQHTFDDVFEKGYNPAAGTWVDHPVLDQLIADTEGNYGFPPRAIRLNVAAADNATDGATLHVVQAGGTGGS